MLRRRKHGGRRHESLIQRSSKSENISVSELNTARCEYLKETYGVNAMVDAKEAMKEADMIIIAVLPKIVPVVARTIKGSGKGGNGRSVYCSRRDHRIYGRDAGR